MDRYKLSKTDAVRQISDQLKYNTYLKAVNNEPLSSDMEDWDNLKHAKLINNFINFNSFYLSPGMESARLFKYIHILITYLVYNLLKARERALTSLLRSKHEQSWGEVYVDTTVTRSVCELSLSMCLCVCVCWRPV